MDGGVDVGGKKENDDTKGIIMITDHVLSLIRSDTIGLRAIQSKENKIHVF